MVGTVDHREHQSTEPPTKHSIVRAFDAAHQLTPRHVLGRTSEYRSQLSAVACAKSLPAALNLAHVIEVESVVPDQGGKRIEHPGRSIEGLEERDVERVEQALGLPDG
jgi:hypothetical protein